MTTFRLVFC